MALTSKDYYVFITHDLEANLIGDKGCEFFSHVNWPCLVKLDLSSNKIESEGVGNLCRAYWP